MSGDKQMKNSQQECTKLVMAEDMTIYNAMAQKEAFLRALQNCQELDVDLSQVGEMDTAGFQILLLIKREANKAQKTLQISAQSKAVGDLIELFNMSSYFTDSRNSAN